MSRRYRQFILNLPAPLAQEIEEARNDALGVTLGLGEADRQDWFQTIIRLGLADIKKYTNDSRLVVSA
jgi:hypothetical protein